MREHRKIPCFLAALAGLATVSPAAASANSILSGYGGPGQGNQVILGAALLNGGGSAKGGGSPPPGPPSLNLGAPPPRAGASRPAGRHLAGRTRGSSAGREVINAPTGAVSTYSVSLRGGAGHQWMGLSGEDILFVILGLGVLALAGVLTGRLARTQPASRQGQLG
jgi:hypothetical protein